MGALEDRIARLERAARLQQGDAASARQRRLWDRFYHEHNNARRELEGLAPLETPPDLEETREDLLETLTVTLPWYRQHGTWGQEGTEAGQFLQAWQDEVLERLAAFDREEQDD